MISKSTARKLAQAGQLMGPAFTVGSGCDATAAVVQKLGYVQLDTIAVVERAHHHVLWTRFPGYSPSHLNTLQAEEKRVFEYWGHAAAVLPMEDFRYTLPRKRSLGTSESAWMRRRKEQAGHLLEPVLQRIRREGPLTSSDFKTEPGEAGGWWNWKPAKVALEILFWQGDLMVTARRNFQKVYDLTERVLPAWVDQSMPSDEEYGRFLVRRALRAYGLAQEKELLKHLHSGVGSPAKQQLKRMLAEGAVVELEVEGEGQPYYMLKGALEQLGTASETPPQAWLLSPFDNLIIQRERTAKLYGFDYALECYLPKEKRRYGYFVLPVLYGDRFVARLDAKAERKKETLHLRGFWLEEGVPDAGDMWQAIATALAAYARFNRCKRIRLDASIADGTASRLAVAIQNEEVELIR